MDEATRQEVQSQPRPAVGDKRKNLLKAIDLENHPSRHKEKRAKHRSFKPGLSTFPTSKQPSIKIQDIDSSEPARVPLSKIVMPASSQPSQRVPMNLLENEDLAWERFEKDVIGEDVVACYNMSLREFEHSTVHDLFKVCNYFYLILSW